MIRRPLIFAVPLLLLVGFGIPTDKPSEIATDTLPARLPIDETPLGLAARQVPADCPLTEGRVTLGRKLFFDPILSADNTVACASCHKPDRGFASAEPRPRGIRGQIVARRAPPLMNRAFGASFFWDGRAATLEDQALKPIEDPAEMGSTVADAVGRLKADPDYRARFEKEFADGVTAGNLARALASFERVLLRGNSPVDRFRESREVAALTAEERHGLWLYESKGRCWRCHNGPNFSDEKFHNTGVSWGQGPPDYGRFSVTKDDGDKGKFKTPSLRGAALCAPYMHDGSLKSLEEVIDFYNRGGKSNPNLDPSIAPLGLTKDEIKALIGFLNAL